jgi:hypothetical protein
MNQIEEVTKVLRELLNEQPKYVSYDKGYTINLEPFAVKICQLFEPKPDEGLLLTDEEEDRCTPTKEEIDAYLAEPDDAIAKALTPEEKRLVAKCVLYGKKIKQAQLAKAQAHCEKRVREEREKIVVFLRQHWIGYDTSEAPRWVYLKFGGTQEDWERLIGTPEKEPDMEALRKGEG